MEMSQILISFNSFSWGILMHKNTKLGCVAQTKPSINAFTFVTAA
jgi:hypothetical protein